MVSAVATVPVFVNVSRIDWVSASWTASTSGFEVPTVPFTQRTKPFGPRTAKSYAETLHVPEMPCPAPTV